MQLGYGDIHFGKGSLKAERTKLTGRRGGNAEDSLDQILTDKFGELYVHSEKRFGENRNRIDFIIYAKSSLVGIDVFATDEKRAIIKNVAIKIPKYATFPTDVPLFFLVWSDELSQTDINDAVKNMSALSKLPGLRIVSLDTLLEYLSDFEPLDLPIGYKPFMGSA